jgi:phosphatidylglycerol:prolipoprotein diacylglycerol transferase
LRRRDGEVMALLMVTYPITRFLVERLRDDERAVFFGFTISQNISILIFLGGLVFWYYLSRLPVGRYADAAADSNAPSPPIPMESLCPQIH